MSRTPRTQRRIRQAAIAATVLAAVAGGTAATATSAFAAPATVPAAASTFSASDFAGPGDNGGKLYTAKTSWIMAGLKTAEGQQAPQHEKFAKPYAIKLTTPDGKPLKGTPVAFMIMSNGATWAGSNSVQFRTTTDENGFAEAPALQAGDSVRTGTVEARVYEDLQYAFFQTGVTWNYSIVANERLNIASTLTVPDMYQDMTAESGSLFPQSVRAAATNYLNQAARDAQVTFTISGSTGTTFEDGSTAYTGRVGSAGRILSPRIKAGPTAGTATLIVSSPGTASVPVRLIVTENAQATADREAKEAAAKKVATLEVWDQSQNQTAESGANFKEWAFVQPKNTAGEIVQGTEVTYTITGDTGTTFKDGSTEAKVTLDRPDGWVGSPALKAGTTPGTATVTAATADGAKATITFTVTENAQQKTDRETKEAAAKKVTALEAWAYSKNQSAESGALFEERVAVKPLNAAGDPVIGPKLTYKLSGDTGTTFADGTTEWTGEVLRPDGFLDSPAIKAGDTPGTATITISTPGAPNITVDLKVTENAQQKTDRETKEAAAKEGEHKPISQEEALKAWAEGQVHVNFASADKVKLKVLREGSETVELQAGKDSLFGPEVDDKPYQVVITQTDWPNADLDTGSVYFTHDSQNRVVVDEEATQLPDGLTLKRVEGTNQFTFTWTTPAK